MSVEREHLSVAVINGNIRGEEGIDLTPRGLERKGKNYR